MIRAQVKWIGERERIARVCNQIERYRVVCQLFGEKHRRYHLDGDSAGGTLWSTRSVMSLIVDDDFKSRGSHKGVLRFESETTQTKVNGRYQSRERHRLIVDAITRDKGEISG